MPSGKTPPFAHRHNPDGSWDAICSLCVATIAREKIEANLSAHELTHTCDPVRLALFAAERTKEDQ